MKVLVKNPFMYDEEIGNIEIGMYDYEDCTTYQYPRIKYNDEWLDLADIDAIINSIMIINDEQARDLEGYYLLSELEELHENYSFEEFLEYCITHSDDDKTLLDELLEE